MTSSPLLTRVAESIVILCPIDQFGCFNASSSCTCANCCLVRPRNGPPDAVISSLLMRSLFSPCIDWNIALCSLSTGRIDTPILAASGIMICPAVTSVSLFASAISLPFLIAAIVGRMPIIPTIAVTKICASSISAIASSPSMPGMICTSRSASLVFNSLQSSSRCNETSFG